MKINKHKSIMSFGILCIIIGIFVIFLFVYTSSSYIQHNTLLYRLQPLFGILDIWNNKKKKNIKEGFTWSAQTIQAFKKYENTFNPTYSFDLNTLQNQVSDHDVNYLLENNKWYWSDETKQLYIDAISSNTSISIDPSIALDQAQTIYNENAIKQMLAWNTKEGHFLLYGVTIGNTKGLPDNINNIIRCGTSSSSSSSNNNSNNNPTLEKITHIGYDGINGNIIKQITPIENQNIEQQVPGFKFLNGPCNPCTPLNNPQDYSCPFAINVGDGWEVSSIWKKMWST